MKKTLALVLTVLLAFSMFSMAASAATTKVRFVDLYGKEIKTIEYDYAAEGKLAAADFPEVDTNYERDELQEDGSTKKYEYTFKGWRCDACGDLHYPSTFSSADHAKYTEVLLSAEYAKEDKSGNQSFWQFIESLFARINVLFEYFATIFNF